MTDTPQPMSVSEILGAFEEFTRFALGESSDFDTGVRLSFEEAITALNELRRADMEYVIGEDMRPNPYLANVNPQEVGNRLRNIQRARIGERLRSE